MSHDRPWLPSRHPKEDPLLSRRAALAAALVTLLPAKLAGQSREDLAASPGIRGVVLDRETRRSLGDVAVRFHLLGDSLGEASPARSTLTDDEGRFAVHGLADGFYRMEMERFGYVALVDSLSFEESTGLRIQAALVPDAVELEPLLVVAAARSRLLDANGFYRRQSRGVGRFLTREDIDEERASRVSDLLRRLSGVRIAAGRLNDGVVLMRGGCVAEVYMDGVRTVAPYPVDQMIRADEVEAIEVYNLSELPPRFANTQCGAVVVWSRESGSELGRPLTWRRVLAAAGFVAAVLLLVR